MTDVSAHQTWHRRGHYIGVVGIEVLDICCCRLRDIVAMRDQLISSRILAVILDAEQI